MGQLRIVTGGIQLSGQAMVLDALLASSIRSRKGQPITVESSRNFTINTRDEGGRIVNRIFLGESSCEATSVRSWRNSFTGVRYGLDGPGIESRWGEIFRTRPDRPWGPPSLLYNGYRVFPGVKRYRRGVDYPARCSTEVKERVKLYLYSPYGPSWPVLG
jgi:hypothetical protein